MILIALAAAVAAAGALVRPVTVDEAWSLVVARRMIRGERLYRDVFYGAGPLAIWILSLVFRLTRSHGVVVRLMAIAYFLLGVGATMLLVDDVNAEIAAVGAMAAISGLHLHPHNQYSSLSTVVTLWALVALDNDLPWVAGLLAGVALLGKYSVGLVAVVAVSAVAVLLSGPVDAVVVAAFTPMPAGLAMLVGRNQLRWFYRRAVANKRVYVKSGRAGPIEWLSTRSWRRWDVRIVQFPAAVAVLLVAVAPLAGAVQVLLDGSDASLLGLAAAVVGVSVVVPRFDGPHALTASTLTTTSFTMTFASTEWMLWFGIAAWLLAGVGIAAQSSMTRRRCCRRDIPNLEGLAVPPMPQRLWPDQVAGLPREVFIARIDAPLVYATDLAYNPTPFDYPAATTFGVHGQATVLRAFRKGLPVCLGWRNLSSPLTPTAILDELADLPGTPVDLGTLVKRDGR